MKKQHKKILIISSIVITIIVLFLLFKHFTQTYSYNIIDVQDSLMPKTLEGLSLFNCDIINQRRAIHNVYMDDPNSILYNEVITTYPVTEMTIKCPDNQKTREFIKIFN